MLSEMLAKIGVLERSKLFRLARGLPNRGAEGKNEDRGLVKPGFEGYERHST